MKNKIELYSCGLYSSWCYWSENNTLFDCGEGCSLHFRNRVYAIERIFLGHKHGDHTLGLPSFIGIRNSARGDKEKPLEIYYPANENFSDVKDFVHRRNPYLKFELKWIPIKDGDKIKIGERRYVRAFSVEHSHDSLGYTIEEERSRLQGKYVGLNIGELIRSGQLDKDKIHEKYVKKLFAYTLDSNRIKLSDIDGAEIWIADSTFLKASDKEKNTHMTYGEVCSLAKKCNIGVTYAAHISPRYNILDYRETQNVPNVVLVDNRKPIKIKYA